ncbi:MAG: integral rane protein-like protein [Rhodoferax sp.]|nr:integral rane protein-like protein [Rhodoferax sp.]
MVGTGLDSASYMFFTLRSRDLPALVVVSRLVVRADWWFTTPTVFIQPATGLLLAHMAGWPLSTPWLAISIGFFVVAGACWLPVVWLQLRMAAMAQEAAAQGQALPPLFWRYARWWEYLGYPAFAAMLIVFYLMVNKPV